MITENLSTLKINKLSNEQYKREYETGNIDGTAIYLTPDESDNCVKSVNGIYPDENGNVEIEVAGCSAEGIVLYTEQALTPEQQAQARENIGVTQSGIALTEEDKEEIAQLVRHSNSNELTKVTTNMKLVNLGNLINLDTVVPGMITMSGKISTDDRFYTTDYIAVTPGETLNFKTYLTSITLGKMRYIAAYDESKTAVSSAGANTALEYVVPDNIHYIRAAIRVDEINDSVLVSGELPKEYIPYTGESYISDKNFIASIAYTQQQTDAIIAKESEKLNYAIQSEISPDVPVIITFEQGGIDIITGQNTDKERDYLARSGFIPVKYNDYIKFNSVDTNFRFRVYKYSVDGAFIEATDLFWFSTAFQATEDCYYRIQVQLKSGVIIPSDVAGYFTITTALYKRNGFMNLNPAYIKEADRVIEAVLDETADLRLLCFGDPHNFDDYKYHKYNEIMSRGVVDYLVGLGDYVDYKDHGAKSNYRKLLLNAINKAGREQNRIYVTGNHDVSMKPGASVGSSDIDLVMYPKECFDVFYRHLKPCMVTDPEKPYGGYFYIDDAHSKIRLIVLNSNEIVNDDGSVTWYYEQSKISQRQLDWFANTALKVDEDGWSVVVFMHSDYPFWSGENVLFDILASAKNGTSVNRTFTAYCRMETDANGNATSTVDKVNGDTYTVNADFTDGHSVDVIGIVHGHTHFKDWRAVNGINSISVRNDGVHLYDRYISKGTFVRNTVYFFTDIYGHIYTFTAPNTSSADNAVQFEYCAYHTQYGNNTLGYFVQADGNQNSVSITCVSSAPSGATEITGFVRERDGSLVGEESCEIMCINKDTRTITTIPYGTGTRRVISY